MKGSSVHRRIYLNLSDVIPPNTEMVEASNQPFMLLARELRQVLEKNFTLSNKLHHQYQSIETYFPDFFQQTRHHQLALLNVLLKEDTSPLLELSSLDRKKTLSTFREYLDLPIVLPQNAQPIVNLNEDQVELKYVEALTINSNEFRKDIENQHKPFRVKYFFSQVLECLLLRPEWKFSLNISPDLINNDFVSELEKMIKSLSVFLEKEHNIKILPEYFYQNIIIEIIEDSGVIHSKSKEALRYLSEKGCVIAIDDCSTRDKKSSCLPNLSFLNTVGINPIVKIDFKEFQTRVILHKSGFIIDLYRLIISDNPPSKIVIEGVENETYLNLAYQILDDLKTWFGGKIPVDIYFQGYYFPRIPLDNEASNFE